MPGFVKVLPLNELAEGAKKKINIGDRDILLVRLLGRVYATQALCTHEDFDLIEGKLLENHIITCPFHESEFDLESGQVLAPPAENPLKIYNVKIENEAILVEI